MMYNWGLAFALAGIYIYFFKPKSFQPVAHGVPYKLTMLLFILCGLAALYLLLSSGEEGFRSVMKLTLLALLMAFSVSSRLASSHIFSCLPFAWLAFSAEIDGMGRMKYALFMQFFVMSAFYLVYIVFFRSHGIML